MIFLFAVILGLIPFPQTGNSSLHFSEEYIEFRLDKNIFTVNGDYLFVNPGNRVISKTIMYPFPVDISLIDSVHVFNKQSGTFLPLKKERRDVRFNILLAPRDSLKLNIFYRHQQRSDTLIYILTTTKNWRQALRKAEYSFESDPEVSIKSFSYKPDKISGGQGHKRYFWIRHQFMPEKDFLIILNKKLP